MKYRVTAGAGIAALAAAAIYAVVGAAGGSDDQAGGSDGAATAAVVAPPSPGNEEPAAAIEVEPSPDDAGDQLVLAAPAQVEPGSSVTFGARWRTPAGEPVDGEVDLQRIEGTSWSTITAIPVHDGAGEVEVQVKESGIYRLAYGGADALKATVSDELVVIAGAPMASRITATAESTDAGDVSVTAAWTTEGGVPIIGGLELEQADGEGWQPVSTAVTGAEGTATAETSAEQTARFRFSYAGGSRFGAVVSDEALALGEDVRTIPVQVCHDDPDIDVLPRGVGCHYTPVGVGTFVVAHDYLDNAWWNSIPMGSYVELTGELPGLYEVADRVIAPGRGSALGSASNWTCGDECDVVLQTCQGANTGFTWLRRVSDAPAT